MHTIIGIAFLVWLGWIIWDVTMVILYHLTPSDLSQNDDYEE